VALSEQNVAPKPKTLDFQGAATLPTAALTAWQALLDHGGLQAGQKVLIHGAAGGVGHFAVQIARWKGAHVIGTGSTGSETFVRGLGADEFINYRTTRFEDVVQDADIVFDTVGGETLERSYAAAKSGGIVVSIAGRHNEEAAKARGVRTAGFSATATRAQLDALTEAVDAGKIKPTISAVFPLEQANEALEQNKQGHTRGKLVISVP
jgi:NADPH:quinone reductase-like Zn-dependent oxidoreductase